MIYATWNWFTAFATRNSPLRTSFMTSVQHVTHILAHICWLAIEFNWLAIDVRLLCDDQQQLKSGLGSPFTQFESLITHNVLDLSDFGASPYSKWIHISNFFILMLRGIRFIFHFYFINLVGCNHSSYSLSLLPNQWYFSTSKSHQSIHHHFRISVMSTKTVSPTFAREKLAQYVSFPWVKDKVSNVINCRNKLKINKDRK